MSVELPNCWESTESSCNSSSSSSSVVNHPVPQINSKNRLKRCRGGGDEEEDHCKTISNKKNCGNVSNNNGGGGGGKHTSYVGVRMRAWGKWVSEIREPKKKSRIWLGTFATPEMAARAHDVASMSIKGTSATLNFPQFSHLLPRPDTCSPRDVQAAAVKAAHMDHLNPSSSSALPAPMLMTSPETSMTSSSSSCVDDEESRLQPELSAAADQEELGEIVELPRLGTSYAESTQEVMLSLYESDDQWWDNYGNCEYFFGEENYISSNMEFTGLENVVSSSFESFLWQH